MKRQTKWKGQIVAQSIKRFPKNIKSSLMYQVITQSIVWPLKYQGLSRNIKSLPECPDHGQEYEEPITVSRSHMKYQDRIQSIKSFPKRFKGLQKYQGLVQIIEILQKY